MQPSTSTVRLGSRRPSRPGRPDERSADRRRGRRRDRASRARTTVVSSCAHDQRADAAPVNSRPGAGRRTADHVDGEDRNPGAASAIDQPVTSGDLAVDVALAGVERHQRPCGVPGRPRWSRPPATVSVASVALAHPAAAGRRPAAMSSTARSSSP